MVFLRKSVFITFFSILFVHFGFAQGSADSAVSRPKVALVLSGGGARGLAEIPFLEAIEQEGIPVDMVLGTSFGALTGALYASGYSPKEIRSILTNLDYAKLFMATPVLSERVPQTAFSNQNANYASIPFTFTGFKQLPGIGGAPGLIGEQNILNALAFYYSRVLDITDFDRLNIPFRAIAADASTGQKIVYKDGSLVSAIRGSISIPLVFTPAANSNGQYAMDGGLVDNLPIEEAKKMGADFVIAVDVLASPKPPAPDDIGTLTDVVMQIFNFAISSTSAKQIQFASLYLAPDLDEYGLLDFFKADEIIRAGEKCVEKESTKITELAEYLKASGVQLRTYDEDRKSHYSQLEDAAITSVKIVNLSPDKNYKIPNETAFAKFIGKKSDKKTHNELLQHLGFLRNKYNLSSLTYQYELDSENTSTNGAKSYTLVVYANRYKKASSRFYFSGEMALMPGNNGIGSPDKQLRLLPYFDFSPSLLVQSPFNLLANIRLSDVLVFDISYQPAFYETKTNKLAFDLGAAIKYGSLEPASSFYQKERIVNNDKSFVSHAGIKFTSLDTFTLHSGFNYDFTFINSTKQKYNLFTFYLDSVFTNFENALTDFSGSDIEFHCDFGWQLNAKNIFSVMLQANHQLELKPLWNSLGFGGRIIYNRMPSSLTQGWFDYGGFNGMCGYNYATFRRNFAIAQISFKQKIFEVLGYPAIIMAQAKAACPLSDFTVDKIDYGIESYLIIKTMIANIALGGSINAKGLWNISLSLR